MVKHVYELIADELVALGVEAAFGLMGEDTAGLIVDLDRRGVAYYGASHENVAVAMADGYAWAVNRVGVAIISRGPGLTNAMTALTTAAKAGRPLLVVSGSASTAVSHPSADAKRIDQRQMVGAIGVEYFAADEPDAVVPVIRAAFACAASGRVAQAAIPPNVLAARVAPEIGGRRVPVAPKERAAAEATVQKPSAIDVSAVVDLLGNSERPLFLAGRGGMTPAARVTLISLAERTGGLLGTSLLAKSLFRGQQRDVGVVGGFSTATAREVLASVDCVVAFGASLNSFTRAHGTIFPKALVIQIDADPAQIGLFGHVDLGVVADAELAATAILAGLGSTAPATTIVDEPLDSLARQSAFGDIDQSVAGRVDPRPLSVALDRLIPTDRVAIMDAGHHFGFPATALGAVDAGHFRLTSSFSAVGMGLGAAMGAAIARPSLPVALFIGDGGLLMTLGDLQTAVRYRLRLIIVVMNDAAYGAERHFMDLEGLPHALSALPALDFAPIAESVGIPSAVIRTVAELEDHLPLLARDGGPTLLDCKINPAVRAQWLEDLDAYRKAQFAAAASTS